MKVIYLKKAVMFVFIFAIIIMGVFFYRLDKENLENKQEPKYCLKFTDEGNKKIKYLCLGYAVYREYTKSPKEAISESKSLKLGFWFFNKEKVKFVD